MSGGGLWRASSLECFWSASTAALGGFASASLPRTGSPGASRLSRVERKDDVIYMRCSRLPLTSWEIAGTGADRNSTKLKRRLFQSACTLRVSNSSDSSSKGLSISPAAVCKDHKKK